MSSGPPRRNDLAEKDEAALEARKQGPPEPPPAGPIPPAPQAVPEPLPRPGRKTAPLAVAKLSKKERKLAKDAERALDSWERYRALTDVLDEAMELVDLADHKARFALLIMGALNALLFVLASSADVVDFIPEWLRGSGAAFIAVYGLVAIWYFLQAIESLRPRQSQPQARDTAAGDPANFPLGLRFYEDALRRNVDDYRQAWRDVRIGQLNAELSVQAHALAQINREKYTALGRLYFGLKIMTLMAAVLMALGSYFVLAGKGRETAAKALRARSTDATALGDVQEIKHLGVKEPSGVAFHPGLNRLFVVGDEGTLAELDDKGRLIRTASLEPQIEDVTVTPSGDLLFLNEKSAELILYDPLQRQERHRWKLDVTALLGQESGEKNQGFEGMAYRVEAGRPGGGVLYLTHQRSPSAILALVLDPATRGGRLGKEALVARKDLDYEDLTAVAFDTKLHRLLVVADAKDRLLVLQTDGTLDKEIALPGQQQEGLALDAQGNIWIADDQAKSLLLIVGGQEALRGLVQAPAPAATPGERRGLLLPLTSGH